MGGYGRGRKKNTEKYESGWEAKGPCLCTVHPAASSTVLRNKAIAAAKKKIPFAKPTLSSRHIHPCGWPRVPVT